MERTEDAQSLKLKVILTVFAGFRGWLEVKGLDRSTYYCVTKQGLTLALKWLVHVFLTHGSVVPKCVSAHNNITLLINLDQVGLSKLIYYY